MFTFGQPIYLDNNATTCVDSRVLDAMIPYFVTDFGNAASRSHEFGWRASTAVENARAAIATAINARGPSEIIFTSGATESINLALRGLSPPPKKGHVITTEFEHKAVLDSCKRLEQRGYRVTYLPVDRNGLVDIDQLFDAMDDTTFLVSVMMANNEIGTIQDIRTIGSLCRDRGVVFHTDATQAVGKVPVDLVELNVDMASFTAHKFYGPKGVGALAIDVARVGHRISAQIDGGGHERGYRSGTLNVPGIVGFAKAIEIAVANQPEERVEVERLRNRLHDAIIRDLPNVHFNGHPTRCLPGLCNLSFDGIDADSILLELSDVALSSGSACTSAQVAPSHVLKAIGLNDDLARASVRFGVGRFNTTEEIDYTAARVIDVVARLRAMSPITDRVA